MISCKLFYNQNKNTKFKNKKEEIYIKGNFMKYLVLLLRKLKSKILKINKI